MKLPDLHDLEIAGVHAWHGDLQSLGTAVSAAKLRLLAADLKEVNSKADLLKVLAAGLKLPSHFGNNWDALADSVEDGAWLGKNGVAIVLMHTAPYRKAHGIDWTMLEDILAEAADYWRERHKPFWVFVS